MLTSVTIKSKQYNPITPTRIVNGRYYFTSESRDRVEYSTERDPQDPKVYRCGCPAVGLCKHITAMVIDHSSKLTRVSLWTNLTDAQRQKRQHITLVANSTPFYVTYRHPPTQRVCQERDRVQEIQGEIDQLGEAVVRARRRWYSTGNGQIKGDARAEIQELEDRIGKLTRERERAVLERGI